MGIITDAFNRDRALNIIAEYIHHMPKKELELRDISIAWKSMTNSALQSLTLMCPEKLDTIINKRRILGWTVEELVEAELKYYHNNAVYVSKLDALHQGLFDAAIRARYTGKKDNVLSKAYIAISNGKLEIIADNAVGLELSSRLVFDSSIIRLSYGDDYTSYSSFVSDVNILNGTITDTYENCTELSHRLGCIATDICKFRNAKLNFSYSHDIYIYAPSKESFDSFCDGMSIESLTDAGVTFMVQDEYQKEKLSQCVKNIEVAVSKEKDLMNIYKLYSAQMLPPY